MSASNFIREAMILANNAAAQKEVPVGAVIVLHNQIIARGQNQRETLQDPTSHAEIHALQEAAKAIGSWRLNDCELYVTLEPCMMCLAACQQARIKKIYYGVSDSKGGAISLGYRFHEDPRTNHRFNVECLEITECGEVLREFFKAQRAKPS